MRRLRARPDPNGWSALERIAHVADWLHRSARAAQLIREKRVNRDEFVELPRESQVKFRAWDEKFAKERGLE
jgi:hypothetical protein